jgi:uncharacterized protein YnzC (UPF0291/DUF896 family)
MRREFRQLDSEISKQEIALAESRKTKKLTGAEQTMISTFRNMLLSSQKKVEKEMLDVAELTNQSD